MINLDKVQSLADLQAYISEQCIKRGWDKRTDLERMAMLTEEVGEVAKEIRRHQGRMGYKKPENTDHLAEELIDALNFIVDIANSNKIDLEKAFKTKWDAVQTREWHIA